MNEFCVYAAAEWTRGDLNPRPRRCKRRALPAELRAPHTAIVIAVGVSNDIVCWYCGDCTVH